jgi:hypothetical protein
MLAEGEKGDYLQGPLVGRGQNDVGRDAVVIRA